MEYAKQNIDEIGQYHGVFAYEDQTITIVWSMKGQ